MTSLAGVRIRELVGKRLFGYLSWRRRRRFEHGRHVLDALVRDLAAREIGDVAVTGDLTNLGTPRECSEALEWLRGLGTPERVTVVGGNHDRMAPAPWAPTIGRWCDYMCGDDDQPSPDLLPFVRRRGSVALIGLNTAMPTAPLLATGRVGEAALEHLACILQWTAAEGLCRVVLMHHPPLAHVVDRRRALDDAQALQRVIRSAGAELVLHGHAHESGVYELAGPDGAIPVLAAPSASSTANVPARRAAYYEIEIAGVVQGDGERRWQIGVTRHRYDAATGAFDAEESWQFGVSRREVISGVGLRTPQPTAIPIPRARGWP